MDRDKAIILPLSTIDDSNLYTDLYNIAVTKAGYYNKIDNHFIKRNNIDEYILIYCISGEGWIEINNKKTPIKLGNIIYLNRDTSHSYGSNKENPWSIFWIHFKCKNTNIITETLNIDIPFLNVAIGYNNKVIEFFKNILDLMESNLNTLTIFQCTNYLNLILCDIVFAHNNKLINVNGRKAFINTAIEFIESNVYNTITLEDVSSFVGLSKYHFSREFKKATSYTPIEYFNKIKIHAACSLLTTTDLTISEISYKLSYSTPYYFSEYFKDITGFSPSQYRKSYNSYY